MKPLKPAASGQSAADELRAIALRLAGPLGAAELRDLARQLHALSECSAARPACGPLDAASAGVGSPAASDGFPVALVLLREIAARPGDALRQAADGALLDACATFFAASAAADEALDRSLALRAQLTARHGLPGPGRTAAAAWGGDRDWCALLVANAEQDRMSDQALAALRQVAATPASTMAGLVAKARVARADDDGNTARAVLADVITLLGGSAARGDAGWE